MDEETGKGGKGGWGMGNRVLREDGGWGMGEARGQEHKGVRDGET